MRDENPYNAPATVLSAGKKDKTQSSIVWALAAVACGGVLVDYLTTNAVPHARQLFWVCIEWLT